MQLSSFDMAVTAPGKLYLFGEYGVLAGGWALVTAVDRRVAAGRRAEPDEYRVRGGETDDLSLVEAVLAAVKAETDRAWSPGDFETDVTAFREGGENLGLGSSAASCVALTAAALADRAEELEEQDVRDTIFSVAERAHRNFQGGRGSGGGVAASTFGGVAGFRRQRPTPMFADQAIEVGDGAFESRSVDDVELAPVSLPTDVEIRPVWLGSSASTTNFLGALERKLQLDPVGVYRRLRGAAEAARDALRACREDDAGAFVEAVADGETAMVELGEQLDVPIATEAHARLHEVAESTDVRVKPSGAGGGDFSLAVGTDRTDWRRFEADLPAGLRLVELAVGASGLGAAE